MIEHEFTEDITCPYCGDTVSDSYERDDEGSFDCDCGESFEYCRNITVTYSTSKKQCEKDKHDYRLENYMKSEKYPVYDNATKHVEWKSLNGKTEYSRISKCSICDKLDIQDVIKEEYDLAPQEIKI